MAFRYSAVVVLSVFSRPSFVPLGGQETRELYEGT